MSEKEEIRKIKKGLNIMAETISADVVSNIKRFVYDEIKDSADELHPWPYLITDQSKLKFCIMVNDHSDHYSLDELILDELESMDGTICKEKAEKVIHHLKNVINKVEQNISK